MKNNKDVIDVNPGSTYHDIVCLPGDSVCIHTNHGDFSFNCPQTSFLSVSVMDNGLLLGLRLVSSPKL